MVRRLALGSILFVALLLSASGCLVVSSESETSCSCYQHTQCETYCDATSCWQECFETEECPTTCSGGTAQDCSHDGDCGPGRVCIESASGGRCRPDSGKRHGRGGICQSCENAYDCAGSASRCVALGDSAVEATICSPTCRDHADCPTGFECVRRGDGPGQCLPTSDGGARSCDDLPNLECTSADDCRAGEVCVENNCRPPEDAECSGDDDCSSDEVCRDFECRPADRGECVSRSDCRSGEICKNGECISGNSSGGECVLNEECAGDARCVDGRCLSRCEDRNDCNPREFCRLGLCQPIECRRNTDCVAGQVCVEATCRPACRADADCSSGYVCSPNGFCKRDPSVQCRNDAECARDEICHQNSCRTPCRCSDNCSDNNVCDPDSQVCTPPGEVDQPAEC